MDNWLCHDKLLTTKLLILMQYLCHLRWEGFLPKFLCFVSAPPIAQIKILTWTHPSIPDRLTSLWPVAQWTGHTDNWPVDWVSDRLNIGNEVYVQNTETSRRIIFTYAPFISCRFWQHTFLLVSRSGRESHRVNSSFDRSALRSAESNTFDFVGLSTRIKQNNNDSKTNSLRRSFDVSRKIETYIDARRPITKNT